MSLPVHDTLPKHRFGEFGTQTKKPLMAMIEVTNRCNMACPICFADSRNAAADVPIAQIESRLQRLLQLTQTPIPIQISGGEPSLRDDLPQIVSLAKKMGYRNIEINTNGIRISEDRSYLEALKESGLTAVYLQFDGLESTTTQKIRGRDMTSIRQKAVEVIRQVGLCCTLAVVVTKGVNEREIGGIVNYGIENIDVVRAINFQSAARFDGRFGIDDQYEGYSMTELLGVIESATGVPADSFHSEQIGHPACNAMSPVFIVNGKLEPLFKFISDQDLRAFVGPNQRELLLATFAGKRDFFYRHLLNPKAWKMLAKAAPIFGANPFNILRSKHLLLFAKAFMEKDHLDDQRMDHCCYAITAADGIFSFCAYNNLYRFGGTNQGSDEHHA